MPYDRSKSYDTSKYAIYCIVFDTLFLCKIHVPAVSMACPYPNSISRHHSLKVSLLLTFSSKANA